MYQSNKQGWLKHVDFLILDLIVTQFAYIIAYIVRHFRMEDYHWLNVYRYDLYKEVAVIVFLATLIADFATDNHRNILKRGILSDLKKCLELFVVVSMACIG